MTRGFGLSPKLQATLDKLARKDRSLALPVRKKIAQIVSLDEAANGHFKNLSGDLSGLKRVHVGNFVLAFKVKGEVIQFESLRHHDEAYRR